MSTKRDPLLSDEQIVQIGCGILHKDDIKKSRSLQHLFNAKYLGALQVRDHYEAARAKDTELIQRLVDAGNRLASIVAEGMKFQEKPSHIPPPLMSMKNWQSAVDAAESINPSKQ